MTNNISYVIWDMTSWTYQSPRHLSSPPPEEPGILSDILAGTRTRTPSWMPPSPRRNTPGACTREWGPRAHRNPPSWCWCTFRRMKGCGDQFLRITIGVKGQWKLFPTSIVRTRDLVGTIFARLDDPLDAIGVDLRKNKRSFVAQVDLTWEGKWFK